MEDPNVKTKKFPRALIGYRGWNVSDDGTLKSIGDGKTIWRPGLNLAYCSFVHAEPPVKDCS